MAHDTTTTLLIYARRFDGLTSLPDPQSASTYIKKGAINTWLELTDVGLVSAELLANLGIKTPALLKVVSDRDPGVFGSTDRLEIWSDFEHVRESQPLSTGAQVPLEVGPNDSIRFFCQGGGKRMIRLTLNPLTGLESSIWNQRCCAPTSGSLTVFDVNQAGVKLEPFQEEVLMVRTLLPNFGDLFLPPLGQLRPGQRVCVVQRNNKDVTIKPSPDDSVNGGAGTVTLTAERHGAEFQHSGTALGWFTPEKA